MSGPYCPDCGAQCMPGADACPECQFPLVLDMVAHDEGMRIDARQMDRWKRISQLLKRSGLRINTSADPARGLMWWLLPLVGASIFVATVLFGHKIVDKIWEPPQASAHFVNLADPKGENTPTGDGPGTEDSVEFLRGAFKTSQEQEELSSRDSVILDDYIDRPIADLDQIRTNMRQAFLNVRVNKTRWRGTLVSESGLILVDTRLVEDAFRREIRTVNKDRAIRETAVWIVPEAGFPGTGKTVKTQHVVDGNQVGLTLLSSALNESIKYKIDFANSVSVGNEVWIAKEVNGKTYPEKVEVIDAINYNEDVNVWVLDSDMGPTYSGSPVLDVYGALIGIVLHHYDEVVMVPTLTLRERAPLVYKKIY